jgi:exodeoxyribonuclease V alpha subunit
VTTLTGTVDRVVFQSPDEAFAVARFRVDQVGEQRTYEELTTLVGTLGRLTAGENLRVGGEWERHPRHGRHFRVQWLEQRIPATAEGIERFLGSGLIKGIGATTAARIVDFFGEKTIEVIENNPARLREVPKLSRKRADIIVEGWREQRNIRELMLFLRSHDLPASLAKRLQDRYGEQCVSVIQADPYQLVQDVYGIGFKTADDIAVGLGLPPRSTSRFMAAMKHVLDEAAREGHVFLPKQELLQRASKLLRIPVDQIEPGLLEASRQKLVVLDGDSIYAAPFFYAERNSASLLMRMQAAPSFMSDRQTAHPEIRAKEAIASLGISLAPAQIEGLVMALREKVGIITGGPGTGKTMCLHAVISALDTTEIRYSLCAPTGRAAKRMTVATGRAASTIHRLLGYQPATNDFSFNQEHRLEPQVVIVDEVSMIDILLFHNLLKAMPDEGHLILVGDADQLPAVGAGNVLGDLLRAECIPRITLNELFRQARDSRITTVAHQIRRGEMPGPESGGDLYLARVGDADGAQTAIKELVATRIPKRFGLDPKLDVQVLSPTHKGPAGVAALNLALQELLNPSRGPDTHITSPDYRLRPGDKVMQVRNNYDKDVYNGDVGLVAAVDAQTQGITVRFGELNEFRDVDYEAGELGDLILAYAVSVHKSQGSEFPCVVMPLLTAHYPLLQRNLVYTALTRAQRLCVLVYQPKALGMAVSEGRRDRRFSGLADRLNAPPSSLGLELLAEPMDSG